MVMLLMVAETPDPDTTFKYLNGWRKGKSDVSHL